MTHLLVIGFSKAVRGKGVSKNKPILVKTPPHRRSMEVRRSGMGYGLLQRSNKVFITVDSTYHWVAKHKYWYACVVCCDLVKVFKNISDVTGKI